MKSGIIKQRLIAYPAGSLSKKAYVFEIEVSTSTTIARYHLTVDETTFSEHKDGSRFEWDP
jgi:hypothetical protein